MIWSEDVGELNFILVAGHIADVRRADDVIHAQQGVGRADHGFVFIDVHRRQAWMPRT